VRDLGYEGMSLQLQEDLIEFSVAFEALKHGKMPYAK
jgi:hypothetical protein